MRPRWHCISMILLAARKEIRAIILQSLLMLSAIISPTTDRLKHRNHERHFPGLDHNGRIGYSHSPALPTRNLYFDTNPVGF